MYRVKLTAVQSTINLNDRKVKDAILNLVIVIENQKEAELKKIKPIWVSIGSLCVFLFHHHHHHHRYVMLLFSRLGRS